MDNHIILGDPEKAEILKQSLIEKYKIEKGEVKTVFADEISIKALLDEVDFLPLFSNKKLIHIKNCEKISTEDCKLLKEFFENPAEDVLLILSGTEIKNVLADYVDLDVKQKGEPGLYPAIFRMRSPRDKKKVIALLKRYMSEKPLEFPSVINASFIYIRNMVKNQKNVDKKLLDAYQKLYHLDFNLKVGRLDEEEFDIFLFSLLP